MTPHTIERLTAAGFGGVAHDLEKRHSHWYQKIQRILSHPENREPPETWELLRGPISRLTLGIDLVFLDATRKDGLDVEALTEDFRVLIRESGLVHVSRQLGRMKDAKVGELTLAHQGFHFRFGARSAFLVGGPPVPLPRSEWPALPLDARLEPIIILSIRHAR